MAPFPFSVDGTFSLFRWTVDPNTTVVTDLAPWFARGLKLYRERRDKSWSLTDRISFEVMKDRGISDALTGDQHAAPCVPHRLRGTRQGTPHCIRLAVDYNQQGAGRSRWNGSPLLPFLNRANADAEVGGESTLAHAHFSANPRHVDLLGDMHDTTVVSALRESEGLLGAGDHALPWR
jgi:hypothetical protein